MDHRKLFGWLTLDMAAFPALSAVERIIDARVMMRRAFSSACHFVQGVRTPLRWRADKIVPV